MDSLGQRLQAAREQASLTVEQVSRDTHISRRFIEGLEREDFAGFPGETYTMGFLRNYAAYLGLDPEEMVSLYRTLRIQEQPVPMAELLEDRKVAIPWKLVSLVALVVIVVGALAYGTYRLVGAGRSPRAGEPQGAESAAGGADVGEQGQLPPAGPRFVLEESVAVRWFSPGERIVIPFGSVQVELAVVRVDRDLYLQMPGGVEIFAIGDKKRLDLDGDGKIDLQVQFNSMDATAADRRANIGLYKIAKPADEPKAEVASPSPEAAAPEASGEAVRAPVRALSKPVVTLRESEEAGPFTLAASFNGRCLFRYQIDDEERETRLFLKGGVYTLPVERELRLWVSNAGVVDARIAGRQLDLGRQGEVASVRIAWVRDEQSRKQQLKAVPVF